MDLSADSTPGAATAAGAEWLTDTHRAWERWRKAAPDSLAFTVVGRRDSTSVTRSEFACLVRDLTHELPADDGRPIAVPASSKIETAAAIWACLLDERQVLTTPPESKRSAGAVDREKAAYRQVDVGATFDGRTTFVDVETRPSDGRNGRPDDSGFLVLTSGTTGEPAACLLPAERAFLNILWAMDQFDLRPGHIVSSWLPLHHDLGLFTQVVMPVIGQLSVVFSDPITFLRRPMSWLETVVASGAVATTCPSFAMRSIVRLLEKGAHLDVDLSGLRDIAVGAEMISPRMADRFVESLGLTGLEPSALHPSYGLAETTMVLSSSPGGLRTASIADGAGGHADYTIVGRPIGNGACRLVDVDPETEVGRLQFRSPSQMTWKSSVGLVDDESWIETGDRASIIDGEIVVIGRWDDAMTINGRQIPASDVEEVARSISGVEDAAAVTIPAIAPLVVVFVELNRKAESSSAHSQIRATVLSELGLAIDVRSAPEGRLPRTTSGKVKRAPLRRLLEIG